MDMASERKPDFTVKQGATFQKHITWYDASGAVVDITGYTARMHLRRKITDQNPAFILTTENGGIALGGILGTVDLTISAEDTATLSGTYVYDLELASGDYVKRLLQGTITVDPEVTR